jgi:two-component system, cell cycle sensor histidine kinase and response regulator CckA
MSSLQDRAEGEERRIHIEREVEKGNPSHLERSHALLRAALDASLDAIIIIDQHGSILEFNRAAEDIFGFSRADVLGKQMAELLIPPSLRESHYEGFARFLTTGEGPILGNRVEVTALRADGTEFPVELCINKVALEGATLFIGYVRDLSAREEAEKAIRQLAAIVEHSEDAIFSLSLDGIILTWNPGAESLYGYSASEIIGQRHLTLVPQEGHEELARVYRTLSRGESVRQLETVRIRKDRTAVDVAVTLSPIRGPQGDVVGASVVARDISSRVRMQRALKLSEASYRRLFDSHPVPMWVYDPGTLRFLAVNRAAVETYGYSWDEFMKMTIEDIRPAGEMGALDQAVEDPNTGRVDAGIWTHGKKDGSQIMVSIVSDDLEFEERPARVVLATDVTEKQRLEGQLRQSQKVEAIGSLAGGIAHDFNNILTGISGYCALLLDRLDDGELRNEVMEINRAADSAAQLTHQLLAFSRQQVLHPEIIELNEIVREGTTLLKRLIGENIELVWDLDPDAGTVFVDRGQLTQVVLNLAVNARDAMPHGGTLGVNTRSVTLEDDYAESHPGVTPGPHVLLQMSDTGMGMEEAVRNRIFDPFFTTKKQGTGLGLATVHGIVNQSGGHIWVYSEPGKGTTFKVYLPRRAAVGEPAADRTEVVTTAGTEVVLVVEDSSLLRPLVERVLRKHGYTVLVTDSAEEALKVAASHVDSIDLLLTDVVLPGMNGRELAVTLQGNFPDMKVLYTSGYPADMVVRQGIEEGSVAFIEKPYAPSDLVNKVREALHSG